MLDLEPVFLGQVLGVFADIVAEGLRELGLVVEEADASPCQLAGQRLGVADVGQRARKEYAVEARELAANAGGVAVGEHGNLAIRCTA